VRELEGRAAEVKEQSERFAWQAAADIRKQIPQSLDKRWRWWPIDGVVEGKEL